MFKMRTKDNKEIVIVTGYEKSNAICWCDARLHPSPRHKKIASNTVQINIPKHMLEALEEPNWTEIQNLYPSGEFERIRDFKLKEFENGVMHAAELAFDKELHSLLKDGIPIDVAKAHAEKKKQEVIKSRLKPIQCRSAVW